MDVARATSSPWRSSRRLPTPATSLPQGGGTIYLCAADRDGGAVSLIESNYAGFGSGVVDPQTGIAYQNRGAFFRLDPGHVARATLFLAADDSDGMTGQHVLVDAGIAQQSVIT